MRTACVLAAAAGICAFSCGSAFGVTLGQVDDFESGLTSGWFEGSPSPNPPITATEGDNTFLRNVASGGVGGGSRQAMFNIDQWAGDYVSAGVTRVTMDVRNSGNFAITVRLAFQSFLGGRTATNDSIFLAAGSGWETVTFDLLDQTLVENTDSLLDTLTRVQQMRIVASAEPDFRGDPIPSTLDVDNIRALPSPGAAALLALGAVAAGRRRR